MTVIFYYSSSETESDIGGIVSQKSRLKFRKKAKGVVEVLSRLKKANRFLKNEIVTW